MGAILQHTQVLRDPKADQAAKGEALRFLTHFVADVHQPLHVSHSHDNGESDQAGELVWYDKAPEGKRLQAGCPRRGVSKATLKQGWNPTSRLCLNGRGGSMVLSTQVEGERA